MIKIKIFLTALLMACLAGCTAHAQAKKTNTPEVRHTTTLTEIETYQFNGKTYTTQPHTNNSHYTQQGKASYYHKKFNGRKTANGEIYRDSKLTAAHKTLPFGTTVLVTNLKNNRQVIVRINDRGPFIKGREIDLSKAAASQLGLIAMGVGNVRVEKLHIIQE